MTSSIPESIPALAHPAVRRYLGDLDEVMRGADPAERDDVISGIREHIVAALGREPVADERVREVLGHLGSVQDVASVATPGTSPVPRHDGEVARQHRFRPFVALAAGALSLPLVIVNVFLAVPLAVVALVLGAQGWSGRNGDRAVYRAAVFSGGLSVTLVLLGALTLLSLSSSSIDVAPAAPAP